MSSNRPSMAARLASVTRSARDVLVRLGPAPHAGEGAAGGQTGDLDQRALSRLDGEAVVLPDVAGVRDEDRQLGTDGQAAPGEVLGEKEVVGRAAQRRDAGGADLGAEHREVLRAERATLAAAGEEHVAALVKPGDGQLQDAGVGGGEAEGPARPRG